MQLRGDPLHKLSANQCGLADLCLSVNDPSDKRTPLFSRTMLHRVKESTDCDLSSSDLSFQPAI